MLSHTLVSQECMCVLSNKPMRNNQVGLLEFKSIGTMIGVIILVMMLYGCGGGGTYGAPGEVGTHRGVQVWAVVTPEYRGMQRNEVDVVGTVCANGVEIIDAHRATINFSVKNTNISGDARLNPKEIFITKYSIHYYNANDSLGAPPIEMYSRAVYFELKVPSKYNEVEVTKINNEILLDIPRKNKYFNDIKSGLYNTMQPDTYFNNYTAMYVFEGADMWGNKIVITTTVPFIIGEFNYC